MNISNIKGDASDVAFFFELLEFYRSNKRKIKKKIYIPDEYAIQSFCADYQDKIKYENVCKLAFIFSKVLKSQLPSHIHARMVLGNKNEHVEEYANYVMDLKPLIFGLFNLNPSLYQNGPRYSLWSGGEIRKMMLK